ncbi:SDR family oxidoreductase [Paucibacter sp. R3-3]|uniref:SDR family oxidoreductase n=1 Tax=Roseateles agri TaxID=3098619 RepID=A0ABU5DD16_9BURK|nr:SDR family NAD(P)-dependent oxidoreductase [Paucibacter sp. R3-3]MDY0744024.1 SDR family oxidoreductase [Paucibacter sp. R3-3]
MLKSVAIVTGASSGIGRATAVRLARDFGAIVLVAKGAHDLEGAAAEVREAGADALAVQQDLSLPVSADAVVKATLDRFGRIDALVNVAGAVPGLDLFEMSDEQWDAGMALKFHGARRLTLRAWDALKASRGSVVFVSGNAAEQPKAAQAAVAAINAAIEALAKAFSERGVADGVQVNSVSPGAVMTGRRLGMLEKAAGARGITLDEMKAAFLKTAGIARFGEASEIAELMAFAVSPAARWMTGTVLRMDGGELKSV